MAAPRRDLLRFAPKKSCHAPRLQWTGSAIRHSCHAQGIVFGRNNVLRVKLWVELFDRLPAGIFGKLVVDGLLGCRADLRTISSSSLPSPWFPEVVWSC